MSIVNHSLFSISQKFKLPPYQKEVNQRQKEDATPKTIEITQKPLARKQEEKFQLVPGREQFAFMSVRPKEVATEKGRQWTASQMLNYMRKWPSLSAVISIVPNKQGDTDLIVASKEKAIEGSKLAGIYEVMQYLLSSPIIKEAARKYPTKFTVVKPFDSEGKLMAIRLPGPHTFETVTKALQEGGKPNQLDQLKQLIENLPQGRRVALLVGGPSAAGKSSLIDQIKEFAGNRKVTVFPGDMYFKDADDPNLPKTATGSPYWDDPRAMHFDEMCEDIAKLVRDGSADIPVYNFKDVRPGGWRIPGVTTTGFREDKRKHLEMESDSILVIDSLHATNKDVIEKLKSLGLPHTSIYLDSTQAEVRLLRRLIRDYQKRSRSPQRTLSDWDLTTFPGEIHFIRPTILQLDPAQDLFLITKFPKDLSLSREKINQKVKLLDQYGLEPSYPAFATPDAEIANFARSEAMRLKEILKSPTATESEKAKARLALQKIETAARKTSIIAA